IRTSFKSWCIARLTLDFRFSKIFWIDADNYETIEQSFRAIASDPDAQASSVEESSESVLRWISGTTHEWLLVFNNADGDPAIVSAFMPRGNRGNILITSRNPYMRRNVESSAQAEVDKMGEEDAVSLLLKA